MTPRNRTTGIDVNRVILSDVKKDPMDAARQWKKRQGKKTIAHLFPDVPEEIICAAGLLPLPVVGMGTPTAMFHHKLPSFVCPMIRNPLEMAFKGRLDFIDGMIIPYVCDSTRAFTQVWEENFPANLNHTLWLPKKTAGDSVRKFLRLEFNRLKQRLEDFVGQTIKEEDLAEAIQIYNQSRKHLRKLFQGVQQTPPLITYSEFILIVRATMTMSKEESRDLLDKRLENLEARRAERTENGSARILLLGTFYEIDPVLEDIEQAGMTIVMDNLYNGTRYFLQDADETMDPIDALVERHLAKDPQSVYHYSKGRWKSFISRSIEELDIQGVIFMVPEYCEPSEFDYPLIRSLLEELAVPVLFLESDFTTVSNAPVRTRLEAFSEILRGVA